MEILLDSIKTCPECKKTMYKDIHTGPGAWYWCDHCKNYTEHPGRKFLKEVAMSRQSE